MLYRMQLGATEKCPRFGIVRLNVESKSFYGQHVRLINKSGPSLQLSGNYCYFRSDHEPSGSYSVPRNGLATVCYPNAATTARIEGVNNDKHNAAQVETKNVP
jgi:hypothetical protein